MNLSFNDALNELKRKAQIAGKSLSPQEISGMSSGWFDAAAEMSAKKRAQMLAEKAEAANEDINNKRLATEQWQTQEQIDAAKKEGNATGIQNLSKNVVSTLGQDYINSKPGESMIAKGGKLVGDTVGNWFGTGEGMGADVAGLGGLSKDVATKAGLEAANLGGESLAPTIAPAAEGVGSLISSAAGPVGIIGAAEGVKSMFGGKEMGWGGKNNDWNQKSTLQQMTSAPGTAGAIAPLIPGGVLSPNSIGGKAIKVFADAERLVMKPIDWIFSSISKICIIVTACTDRNSPEVEICRQYRDKFLSKTQLRGYYVIAEKIVPLLERNEKARKFTKKFLVDRLIDYGEKRLGKRQRPAKLISIIVSNMFLGLIKITGLVIRHYTRQNGEVY